MRETFEDCAQHAWVLVCESQDESIWGPALKIHEETGVPIDYIVAMFEAKLIIGQISTMHQWKNVERMFVTIKASKS